MSINIPGEFGAAINEAVNEHKMRNASLYDIGAHEDMMGQLIIPNARVTFYSSCGEWEVSIAAAAGGCDFDLKYTALHCGLRTDNEHATAADQAHRHVVSGLRYLLRDYTRDELVALVDEAAQPDARYDIDGWLIDADTDRPETR